MKSPIRVLLAVASSLLLLALLAWISTFFYWHLRIARSVRIRVTQRLSPVRESCVPLWEAAGVLMDAEARAMPYLIAELDESKHPEFIQCASYLIARQSIDCVHEDDVDWGVRMGRWAYEPRDTSDAQLRKFEEMREWWKKHGAEYHPWWRVWSSRCGS